MYIFIMIVLFILTFGLSFLVTAGLYKLIAVLLGIVFSWKIALVIWLIALFISWWIKGNK